MDVPAKRAYRANNRGNGREDDAEENRKVVWTVKIINFQEEGNSIWNKIGQDLQCEMFWQQSESKG